MLTLHKHSDSARTEGNWLGPAPWITTPPPGPKALLAGMRARGVQLAGGAPGCPLVIRRARGSVIEDVDGNRYLDFTAGAGACAIGYGLPQVARAVRRQIQQGSLPTPAGLHDEPAVNLAERLAQLAPGDDPKRVLLADCRTDAVAAAARLVRHRTGRPTIVTLQSPGLDDDRTPASMCHYGDMLYNSPTGPDVVSLAYGGVEALESAVGDGTIRLDRLAAVFIEPLAVDQGYVVPPPELMLDLRAFCDAHGILLVIDETRTGLGRTGRMFACEYQGVVPDVLLIGDGLAGGLPLGAVIARDSALPDGPTKPEFATRGSSLACAAALAAVDLLHRQLTDNAAGLYPVAMSKLERTTRLLRCLADPRGQGVLLAVDVVKPRRDGEPDPPLRDRILTEAFTRGLLLRGCGRASIRLTPPLSINRLQFAVGLHVFEEAVATVAA